MNGMLFLVYFFEGYNDRICLSYLLRFNLTRTSQCIAHNHFTYFQIKKAYVPQLQVTSACDNVTQFTSIKFV